jgi:UDP-N-acetylglucosamine--N-acetylmuramyl-(pentapeptide) pyrophosphoryl-undecaprenol N-acetylglucosamine transferase
MILVSVGTNEWPFDRLVRAARALSERYPVVVQYGASREAHGSGDWVDFMSFDELADAMREADVVVSHAGVGSLLLAQQCGRRPIVVPRRGHLGEAVDDHQLNFARRFEQTGIFTLVEDDAQLAAGVARALTGGQQAFAGFAKSREASPLAVELRDYLQGIAAPA